MSSVEAQGPTSGGQEANSAPANIRIKPEQGDQNGNSGATLTETKLALHNNASVTTNTDVRLPLRDWQLSENDKLLGGRAAKNKRLAATVNELVGKIVNVKDERSNPRMSK